jgi:hypothetical protein
MADQGAAKIKSLLDTPSSSLADLMTALQNGMSATQGDDLVVPSSTYRAITGLRHYYSDLARKVRAIHTGSHAKVDVLAALGKLDASLVSMSKALHEGTGDDALADLEAARQRSAQANSALVHASKRLA